MANEVEEKRVEAGVKIVFRFVAERKQCNDFGLMHYWTERRGANAIAIFAKQILDAAAWYRATVRSPEAKHISKFLCQFLGILCAHAFGNF
jgi:hypothetical protein